jgi:hypothetical protein
MKMGNEVLMTVGKDIIDPTTGGTVVTTPHEHPHDHDDEYASVDHTHLNFSTDVKFHKNVEIHGALVVNGNVKNTKITSAKTYVDNIFATPMSLWTSAYNKYVANSNSVEEVTLILGNHKAAKLDPSYAKYDPNVSSQPTCFHPTPLLYPSLLAILPKTSRYSTQTFLNLLAVLPKPS